jgi:pimeloyl-ACP methyl ester carboxylesterase
MRLPTREGTRGHGDRRLAEITARARLLERLPVTGRTLDVNGTATSVLEGGQGPPVVLLHGGIECGGAYWAPVVPGLAASHRLVVPDVPGLGESDPVDRLDAVAFSDWLAALLGLTCEEPPTLVAHSLLGTMAARFAAGRRGDLLRRLVVYGAPGIGPYRMPAGLRLVAIRFALRPSEPNAERFDRWAFVDLDRVRGQQPDWFDAFTTYTRARAAVPHVKRTMRQLIGSCTKQVPDTELRDVRVPASLLWGEGDRFVPLALARATSSRLGWPLHVVDDAGHATHIERPDAFVGALEDAVSEGR